MLVKIIYCDSNNNITMSKNEFEALLNDVEKDAYHEGYDHAIDTAQVSIPLQNPRIYDTTLSEDQLAVNVDSPMLTNNIDPSEINDTKG